MAERPDLTIVLININHRNVLRDCLTSIYEHINGITLEVMVVDNASSDGSVEMLRESFPQVHLIEVPGRQGFATNNNLGLRAGRGRYLMILNDDTLVLPGALERMVAFMEAHPGTGAVGARLLNVDGTVQPSSFVGYPSLWTEFLGVTHLNQLLRWLGLPGADYYDYFGKCNGAPTRTRRVKHLMGACILVRCEVLDEVRLLDENFFYSFEDIDWCKRINDHRWDICFLADAEIVHLGGQTVKQLPEEFPRVFLASRCYFENKHHGRLSESLVRLLIMINALIKIPLVSMQMLVADKSRRTNHRQQIRQYLSQLHWLLTGVVRRTPR